MVIEYTFSNSFDNKKPVFLGRLKGDQLRKLAGLLDMLYTPAELAVAVGFTRRQIYRAYIPLGCPHERDQTGHVFINGHTFRDWYRKTFRKVKLAKEEAYCLSCKKVVPLVDSIRMQRGSYEYWSARCPDCKKAISKAIANRRKNDKS